MTSPELEKFWQAFQAGRLSPFELSEKILQSATQSSAMLTPDLDRKRRCGFSEVVYAEGKPIDRLLEVIERLLANELEPQAEILATRVSVEQARAIGDQFSFVRWNSRARTIRIGKTLQPAPPFEDKQTVAQKFIAVVSAGTTDAAVAEEACETLGWMKVPVKLIQDVGVAGPYRLLAHLETLRQATAIVVVAGMEGALPSVVAGHVGVPIVAVPTSVGYGANFQGLSALLTMLNSCASNVTVVNIDSGFRAGYVAGLIVGSEKRTPE
jgi:pyridinium-3,5-biscarboxylic acid mononucleotide synthase